MPIADAASSPDDRHVPQLRPRRACFRVAGVGLREPGTGPGEPPPVSPVPGSWPGSGRSGWAVKFQGVTAAGQDVRGAQYSLAISAVTSLLWYLGGPVNRSCSHWVARIVG